MNRKFMKPLTIAAIILLGIILVACGGTTAGKEKNLVMSVSSQYSDTFDISIMPYSMEATAMIYDTLVSVDENGEFQPGALTESYEVSEDGLQTTFHLKKGIKFHDGSDFTSEVVKWNIEMVRDGDGCCGYLYTIVTDIETPDDYTAILHTSGPFPGLIYNLSSDWGRMMSKAKYEECGENYGLSPECTSGTGPFMLKEWVDQVSITLERNPDYDWAADWTGHKGPANVSSITIKFVAEIATRLVELEAGDTHLMTEAPWRDIQTFEDDPNFNVVAIPDATLYYILMPLYEPLLADINTRYGIGYSIDRELIKDTLFAGMGNAKTTYLASEITADAGVVGIDYDPTMAAQKFEDAGWVMGSDGVLVAETVTGVDPGTRFELDLTTYQGSEEQRVTEAIQKMLSDVGIVANIVTLDDSTYSSTLEAVEVQMGIRHYTWDNADILPWFIHSQYIPLPNYTGVNDPDLDDCMDDADYNSATWAERDGKYVKCQQYIIDTHYPWAPFYQRPALWFVRDTVKDLKVIPLRASQSAELWATIDLDE
jgi:peptide/nickel transport system substrate-binding protein